MDGKLLETKLYLESKGYSEYEIEEIIEDYLPEVKKHIGFCDKRSDKRFVVKFHDIFYFTNTPEDMSEEQFDRLFDLFCQQEYSITNEYIMYQCILTEQQLFSMHDIGHYRAFEYIQAEPITEENCLKIAIELYGEGLSPMYINDYVALVGILQDMEDNYMTYWLELLREEEDVPDNVVSNIERRWNEYKTTHKLN